MKKRNKETRKLVGRIGVDAGLCWIGDPCYVFDPQNPRPKAFGESWDDFCDALNDQTTKFNYDMGHEGLGVCVSTGYGDGTYPVYVDIEDGRVKSVTVEFFEDEEDEEDD